MAVVDSSQLRASSPTSLGTSSPPSSLEKGHSRRLIGHIDTNPFGPLTYFTKHGPVGQDPTTFEAYRWLRFTFTVKTVRYLISCVSAKSLKLLPPCQILRLKYTKFDFGWGLCPRPHWESLQRSPILPSWIWGEGALIQRRGEGKRGGKVGRRKGKGEEGHAKKQNKNSAPLLVIVALSNFMMCWSLNINDIVFYSIPILIQTAEVTEQEKDIRTVVC